ncbi:MAG: phosphoenolpyruvate--protein phosphotransferase [Treponema sp.]|nr:phosphoenolpyruvate--protein phosphotransferase [Treponema sp.]
MNAILGISAAGGMGIGTAFVLPEEEKIIPQKKISHDDVASEWKRFEDASRIVQEQIKKHLATLSLDNLQHVIFETYQLMLTDPIFIGEVKDELETQLYNIEHTLAKKVKEYAGRLRNSGNDYLAERAQDIEDVFGRVQAELLNLHPFNIEQVPDGVVIVARALKTSDTVVLSKRNIAGLVLTEGGVSSHVAILARSYGIPAVVGLDNIANIVHHGEQLIVDGDLGEVIQAPDTATLVRYETKIAAAQKYILALRKFRDKPAQTDDGTRFEIFANIGTPEEAQIALEEGADGIGLFRTEFLFMESAQKIKEEGGVLSNSISEEAQFQAYKQVLETMGNRPVTIRTLDSGGDKLVAAKDIPVLNEKNPLMGLRAIRLSLFYPQVFRTQLRALYRASVYGNLRIMLPLITDVSQVDTIRGIARGVQLSLKADNIPFKPDVPIGIMIETAASALISDCLAPHCDFFSLGTNDLTQYTIGIDRENPAVAPLYNEFHLAVLRMIKSTIKNAADANIHLSVCGEMAGRRESAIILAGMGIRTLSMSPKQIPVIKETLSQFTIKELQNISSRSLY